MKIIVNLIFMWPVMNCTKVWH